MRIASWNVNSLNVRMPHMEQWLRETQPDVVALQETKLEDSRFPDTALATLGYRSVFAGQKSYNGVALLVRHGFGDVTDVVTALPDFPDPQKRVIAATIAGTRVVNLYVPNGQTVGSDKYRYKLDWCAAVTAWLAGEVARATNIAVAGDFNIAPEDRDVHDPLAWEGQVMCSVPERAVFRSWQALGLVDSFRLFEQPPNTFSWWDYRMLAFPKNRGLRIDHILLSPSLAASCTACHIDRPMRKGEKPSDHAPVIAEIAP